jgi:hypothetical protein
MHSRLLWLLVGMEIGRSLGSFSGFATHRNDDSSWMKLTSGYTLIGSAGGSLTPSIAAAELPALSSTTDLNLEADTDTDGIGAIFFSTHGTEYLRIANDGKVGIGTTKPRSKLDMQVGALDEVIARFGRDDNGEFQSLLEFRTSKNLISSGHEIGRGAIRLIDTIASPNRTMELGYYEFGAGLFTNNLFEFWSNGVSVLSFDEIQSFLAVRDASDRADIRLRHDGTQGIIETTGSTDFDSGGVQIGGNGPNSLLTKFGAVIVTTDEGNLGIGTTTEFGNGSGVIGIANVTTVPTENPINGGILYIEEGSLKYRGPSGTVTILANP